MARTNNNKNVITTQSIRKAYHGTPYGGFEKFSMTKRGTGADVHSVGDYGKGFYFSPSKTYAKGYATELAKQKKNKEKLSPAIYTVELTMKQPFDLGILSTYYELVRKLMRKYGALNIPPDEHQKVLNKLKLTEEELEFHHHISDLIGDNWADFDIKEKIAENGYDSLISPDGKEFIVYSQKQIKILSIQYVKLNDN